MKRKLEIDEQKAKELYKTGTPEFKQMCIDTFGKEFFCENITDRVKTFEDACEVLDIEPCTVFRSQSMRKDSVAYEKLVIIIQALNEGWAPNWDDLDEYKWYPYFNCSGSFGFSGAYCDDWRTRASIGSRLCFKSESLAKYAAVQFKDNYKAYLM